MDRISACQVPAILPYQIVGSWSTSGCSLLSLSCCTVACYVVLSRPQIVETGYVYTKQIAPTIARLLGIDPMQLQAVAKEGTKPLPLYL